MVLTNQLFLTNWRVRSRTRPFTILRESPILAPPLSTAVHKRSSYAINGQAGKQRSLIGYRFPPTDAEALVRLLGAISENSSQRLKLLTVLGPNTSSPDTIRLAALLKQSVRSKNPDKAVQCLPFYATDFLTTYDSERFRREHSPPPKPPGEVITRLP